MDADFEERFRAAAFAYLDQEASANGLVTREQLASFRFEGHDIPLIEAQRGIRKPSGFEAAISILTTYSPDPRDRPYDDEIGPDGYLRYKWQGTDPDRYDNRGLRAAMQRGLPLMYFVGVAPAVFLPFYPVTLVAEEPEQHQFVVALDHDLAAGWSPELITEPHAPTRRYAEHMAKTRLHQPVFRRRVLIAYEERCALCRLGHRPLLDAAHILTDAKGGEPIVPNGIAMCAIHHRAFDANILGINPRHTVEIRHDVLEEVDGPTLQHALQGLHGKEIALPRHKAERPREDLLEQRYEEFRAAG